MELPIPYYCVVCRLSPGNAMKKLKILLEISVASAFVNPASFCAALRYNGKRDF
jgi:hypothetical protein